MFCLCFIVYDKGELLSREIHDDDEIAVTNYIIDIIQNPLSPWETLSEHKGGQ